MTTRNQGSAKKNEALKNSFLYPTKRINLNDEPEESYFIIDDGNLFEENDLGSPKALTKEE